MVLDALAIEPDPEGVLRCLGYPAGATPDETIRGRVLGCLETCRTRWRPRAAYSIYPVVVRGRRSLTLDEEVTFSGAIGEFLSGATRAAVFIATAGPEIVGLAEQAMQARDTLAGLVYDAIGSWLAEAAVERVVEDLRRRTSPGETLTLRYSPGYCGISLADQRLIFRLADAAPIGVELLETLIMKPVKSVSGLIGAGPEAAVTAYGNPCDRCPRLDCHMRR